MPFDTTGSAHEFNFLLLTFLALAQMVLHVCEQSCTARRTEPRVLHCVCGLEVSGGEYAVLRGYKRKQGEPPLIKEVHTS